MRRTVCSEQAVIFHNVQHSTHLTEYEDAGPIGLQGSQQFVQNNHFTTVLDEVHVCGVRRARFLIKLSTTVFERYRLGNAQPLQTGTDGKQLSVAA